MLRRLAGFFGLLLLVAVGAVYVSATGLPWYAVLYGCLFWLMIRAKLKGRGLEDAGGPVDEAAPRWSSFRGGF